MGGRPSPEREWRREDAVREVSELTPRQEQKVEQVIRLQASIDEARRRTDVSIYRAVRVFGVPVKVLADRLGYTRQNVYHRVRKGARLLDQ